ncbi:MAG: guanylate kinase [Firmicutes bacterium]|nr:guanylate kinase [Bacillota bacterium]
MAGLLFVVSGPSAAGKGTICKRVLAETDLELSVSATTRKPRPGEEHGREYYFLTEEEFVQTIENNGFVEHVINFGCRYGTLVKDVEERLARGKDLILEIDVQGGYLVRDVFPDAILIFLVPPTPEELERRIRNRGTEDEESIQNRLQTARREVKCVKDYDYLVINDDLDVAVEETKAVIQAERCRVTEDKYIQVTDIFKES